MLSGKYMPKGPQDQKPPADVISNAVRVMRIAQGEVDESALPPQGGKDQAAVALGRKGGAARAKSLGQAQRTAIARKAAKARWKGR